MALSHGARALWESRYVGLTTQPPGLLGSVTSRGAPHVLRLAMLYALADRRPEIAGDHLTAALGLWDASARCAAYIFGATLGNPDADRILTALRVAPAGLTRSEIRSGVFQRNTTSERIKAALAVLLRSRLILEGTEATGGRPACRYYAVDAFNAKSLSPLSGFGMTHAPPYGVKGVYGVTPNGKPSTTYPDREMVTPCP